MPENRLRRLREQSGLNMQALAERIGVDVSTISRWETGVSQIPDWRKQQLAELLATSVPHLMGWDTEPNGNGHNGEQAVA